MISIIVCSRTKVIPDKLKKNIEDTIGCDYELVVIDNSMNYLSIFQAYNKGIRISNGDLLCFLHDDVKICTLNWGLILKEIFKNDSEIGVLGIAGGKSKTLTPSSWSVHNRSINIIQHYKRIKKNKELVHLGFNSNLEEVVTLDGVFMVFSPEKKMFFNEKFKGFHFYDMNICMEAKVRGLKNYVTDKITLEHLSEGFQSKDWIKNGIKMHNHYKNELPIHIDKKIKNKQIEKRAIVHLFKKAIYLKEPFVVIPYFLDLVFYCRKANKRLIFNYLKSIFSVCIK
jgi:hypothetical protein